MPIAALNQIADADGFNPCFGLGRREALWAIKGLRDEPLPLFAAASAREARAVAELAEPGVILRPMVAGGEVVEDYRHVGLSLRDHPVSFLRSELRRRRIVPCLEAMDARDGRWLEVAGIVLVRQRPGSAKGTMFITLEDESGIANLVVWPKVFEANRRTILTAGMIAVRGRVQREGEVVHLVAQRFTDLSADLASVFVQYLTLLALWSYMVMIAICVGAGMAWQHRRTRQYVRAVDLHRSVDFGGGRSAIDSREEMPLDSHR